MIPAPIPGGLLSEWLLEPGVIFLNHGSFGAVPRAVFEAQTEWRRRIEAAPVEMLARRLDGLLDEAKQAVGTVLGMRPGDFGLVTNATEGVNVVLQSLDLRPGDELVTTGHVYNAVRQSMRHAAICSGATYREIDCAPPIASADQLVQEIMGGLSDRTRLLVIDHISSPTAIIFPVEEIIRRCRERGIDVFVDGAHAPGMLPLDIERLGASYYAGNLHKWCCAPRGAGFLWVRPDRQERIHPLVISHRYGQGIAREFSWQGTRDVTPWLTAPAALEFMAKLGWERVREHNRALARWAHAMLCGRLGIEPISPIEGSLLGSMASLPLPSALPNMTEAEGDLLQQRLYSEFRIEVPLMPRFGRGFVRLSAHVYNQSDDYHRLAEVLEALVRENAGRGGR